MTRRLLVALAAPLFACAPPVAGPEKPRSVGEAAAPTVVVAEAPAIPAPPRRLQAPPPVQAMGLGDGESCAVLASVPARVVCWGDRKAGGMRSISLPFSSAPVAVTVGRTHRCALLEDGRVACWTALAPAAEVVAFPGGSAAVSVTAGDEFVCALLVGGAVHCWGANDVGQLGLGNTVATTGPRGPVPLGGPAVAVSSGLGSSCALVDRPVTPRGGGRVVVCWGRNNNGALGLGDARDRGDTPLPKGGLAAVDLGPIGAGARPIAISVAAHACVLFDDGAVKCWGWNRFGQLGLGDGKNRGDAPKQLGAALPAVPLGGKAVAIAAAITHSCAILADGAVECWGWNREGELGLGDTSIRPRRFLTASGGSGRTRSSPRGFGTFGRPAPVALTAVDLGSRAIAVAVGAERSCALLDSNVLKCWGANHEGELGLGDTDNRGDKPGQMGAALPAVDFGGFR